MSFDLPIDLQHVYFQTLSQFATLDSNQNVQVSSNQSDTKSSFAHFSSETFQNKVLDSLINDWWQHLVTQELVVDGNVHLYKKLKALLSVPMLTQHISHQHSHFNDFLTQLLNNIEARLKRQVIPRGEAVGMVGAQNISEDSTQKYLKVVHFTGSGASKQFLKSTNALKTILENANTEFQMIFKMKRGHDPHTFGAQIVQTLVKDILSIRHQSFATFDRDTNIAIITFFINNEIIHNRNKSIYQVVHVLCNSLNLDYSACSYTNYPSEESENIWRCEIAISPNDNVWQKLYSLDKHLAFDTFQNQGTINAKRVNTYKQYLINNILQDVIQHVIVSGYEGVYAIAIVSNTVIATCDPNTNVFKFILMNYFNQLCVKECVTNKLGEFNELFGIVATKHKLQHLMSEASSSCTRHLHVLSQLMTVSSDVKGLSRHQAIYQMDPMARAGFSAAFKHLQKACQDAEFDSCSNVCSGLLINNIQNVGKTNLSDLHHQTQDVGGPISLSDYLCSPKADGVRRLLLIHNDCFILIDRRWKMSILAQNTLLEDLQIHWTLLDTELIECDHVKTLLIFDALIVYGHSLIHERYDMRYLIAEKIVKQCKNNSTLNNQNIEMKMKPVFTLDALNVDDKQHMPRVDFPTDGYVFTKASSKLSRVQGNESSPTCFKWKPTNSLYSENTIDVFISATPNENNDELKPLAWGDFVRPQHEPYLMQSNHIFSYIHSTDNKHNTQDRKYDLYCMRNIESMRSTSSVREQQRYVVGTISVKNILPEHLVILQNYHNQHENKDPVFEIQWNYQTQTWQTLKHRDKFPNSYETIQDTLECIHNPVHWKNIVQTLKQRRQ